MAQLVLPRCRGYAEMICTSCGQHVNVADALYQRGYFWHEACADVRDGVVWFPSGGKLAPETIIWLESETLQPSGELGCGCLKGEK